MRKNLKTTVYISILLSIVLMSSGCNQISKAFRQEASENSQEVSLATGGTSGTYFSIGSGIASIVTQHIEGVEMTAESTGASVANSMLLRDGQVEFILASASTASSAYEGREVFKNQPAENMRAVAALYPEVFQFIVLESSGLKKVTDLRHKRIAIGYEQSGTARISKFLLKSHGIETDAYEPVYLSFSDGVAALTEGRVDCVVVGSGLPTAAVVDASASADINLLTIDKGLMSAIMSRYPFITYAIIPEGTYSDVQKDVMTVATNALLIASEQVGDDLVYAITKSIFEESTHLDGIHPQAKNIRLETALETIPFPLHEGAKRYYKEKGLDLPFDDPSLSKDAS